MKHLVRTIFCGVLLLVDLVFTGGAASAHTMPESEWRLLYDAVGGDGAGVVEFAVNMPLQDAEDLLGSGFEAEEKVIEGFRLVYYRYPDVTFCGRDMASRKCPPGDVPIVFIECRSPEFRTPSGFRVGDDFADVEAMYGEGKIDRNNPSEYRYWLDEVRGINFLVDEAGRIEEITVYQVIFS